MATDDDPTTATPADQTQPLPPTQQRASTAPPHPSKTPGWRPAQVAVVALLALLLGGAGGALLYFVTNEDRPDEADLASETTTTTTTTTSTPTTDRTTSSSTAEADATTTVPGSSGAGDDDTGGETEVGNSIYTATYQSNRNRSINDFTIDDDWKIRWNVPTGAIGIEVFDANDGLVERIDAQGTGERSFPDGGTYQVEISTDGSRYTVVITDGP